MDSVSSIYLRPQPLGEHYPRLTRRSVVNPARVWTPHDPNATLEEHFPVQTIVGGRTPFPRFLNRYDSREILLLIDGACANNGSMDPDLRPPRGGCAFMFRQGDAVQNTAVLDPTMEAAAPKTMKRGAAPGPHPDDYIPDEDEEAEARRVGVPVPVEKGTIGQPTAGVSIRGRSDRHGGRAGGPQRPGGMRGLGRSSSEEGDGDGSSGARISGVPSSQTPTQQQGGQQQRNTASLPTRNSGGSSIAGQQMPMLTRDDSGPLQLAHTMDWGKVGFRLETVGPAGDPYDPTSNRAKLRAVIAALDFREWHHEGWQSVVVATDLEYLVYGATRWLPRWVADRWRLRRRAKRRRDMRAEPLAGPSTITSGCGLASGSSTLLPEGGGASLSWDEGMPGSSMITTTSSSARAGRSDSRPTRNPYRVANRDMWEKLQARIEELREGGCTVSFWLLKQGPLRAGSSRWLEVKNAAKASAFRGLGNALRVAGASEFVPSPAGGGLKLMDPGFKQGMPAEDPRQWTRLSGLMV